MKKTIDIKLENIQIPDGIETKLTITGDLQKQEQQVFRTFTYAKDNYPVMETLKHFAWHLQEIGRMLDRTISTDSLFKDKE